MSSDSSTPSAAHMDRSARQPVVGGYLLAAGGALGVVTALAEWVTSFRVPVAASGAIGLAGLVTGLVALVMAGTGLLYVRRRVASPAMSWIVFVFVLVVSICGLPNSIARVENLLDSATSIDEEQYQAKADALAVGMPVWVVFMASIAVFLQIATCLVVSVQLSRKRLVKVGGADKVR